MWLPRRLNLKGLTFKLLYVVYTFYSNGNFQRKCVRPLEVKFPKSHILLVHSMLPNCGFSIVRKKGKILYPRCGLGACLRCDEHLKYSDYRADGIWYSFFFRLHQIYKSRFMIFFFVIRYHGFSLMFAKSTVNQFPYNVINNRK